MYRRNYPLEGTFSGFSRFASYRGSNGKLRQIPHKLELPACQAGRQEIAGPAVPEPAEPRDEIYPDTYVDVCVGLERSLLLGLHSAIAGHSGRLKMKSLSSLTV